ncbi:hypothetical protein [Ileibacterium valens]|uniref:hypothetical protein n=1 Tax=Ileibacterium valens TaxID=1862668 RepID=UPI00259AF028|nr:hypothetical protein [Ileibacterium valens]
MIKKFHSLLVIPILIAGIIVLDGCSNRDNDEAKTEVVLISEPEMENILTNSGWDIQSTSAASFHLWEQLDPTILLLAENKNSEVLIIGEFDSEEKAVMAYESSVPLTDSNVIQSNEDGHLQALVPLGESDGYWLFRQTDKCVMGGWMQDTTSQEEFETLFTSFQTNAPVIEDETTIPSDDSSVVHGEDIVNEAQGSEESQEEVTE